MMAGIRSVSWREVPDLVNTVIAAVVVEVGIRTLPLPRLARLVGAPLDTSEPAPREGPAPVWSLRSRQQVRTSQRVFRHWPFGDTCLRQALVLGWLLRRLDPVLRVGVAKLDGAVRAHAWLEIAGTRLDPIGGASSYQVLLPARSPGLST